MSELLILPYERTNFIQEFCSAFFLGGEPDFIWLDFKDLIVGGAATKDSFQSVHLLIVSSIHQSKMFPEAEDDEEKKVPLHSPAVTSGPAAFLIADVWLNTDVNV